MPSPVYVIDDAAMLVNRIISLLHSEVMNIANSLGSRALSMSSVDRRMSTDMIHIGHSASRCKLSISRGFSLMARTALACTVCA